MARGDAGSLLSGFHGRLNDIIVIKQRNGKPVMCCYPKGKKIKWTENQKARRLVFRSAIQYAKGAIKDPERLAFYKAREHDGINAYNLAIADYMNKPVITSIDIRKARSRDAYLVRVHATDEFLVTKVDINLGYLDGRYKLVSADQYRKCGTWTHRISASELSTVHSVFAMVYAYPGTHSVKEYLVRPEEALKRLPHS